MKTTKILLLCAALTTFAGPVFAHHSHATIDMDDVRMYSGIVDDSSLKIRTLVAYPAFEQRNGVEARWKVIFC